MMKCLSFGGNLVKQTRHLGSHIEVEALDLLKPAPNIDSIWHKPWLVQWATQETVVWKGYGENRIWKVLPFPQIRKDGQKTGTPFPFIGVGNRNRIRKERLKSVENGAEFSPYVLFPNP